MAEVDARWTQLLTLDSAVDDPDVDDEAWVLVAQLQAEADESVLALALAALSDDEPWHRQAAAWVVGQFGYPEGRPFGSRVAPELLRAARAEGDDDVRSDLVAALGHVDDAAWLEPLVSFADDPASGVRRAVAISVPLMPSAAPMTSSALAALITLSRDPDPGVRDWATFGLARQTSQDSPAIRAALLARLDDDDPDTAAEALLGLARRGDPEASARVAARITEAESVDLTSLEAAAELADPTLLPALEALAHEWAGDEDAYTQAVALAIARCDPSAPGEARRIEQQIVAAVDERVAGTGWSLALEGTYPRTLVWFRPPDGAVDVSVAPDALWEAAVPGRPDVDEWVRGLVRQIHEAAARQA